MKNLNYIKEKFLYEIWEGKKFNHKLYSITGDEIDIIDPGIRVEGEDGPDYKNARINIGGIKYVGDVEIDTLLSDWINHGHNANEKYNKVVLHIFFNKDIKDFIPKSASGRNIQALMISNFLENDVRTSIRQAISLERDHRLKGIPCQFNNSNATQDQKLHFIRELGIRRFEKKCTKILDRLKEIHYEDLLRSCVNEPSINYELNEEQYNKNFTSKDFQKEKLWQQLFYELVFEALGYSKNKDVFKKLAQEADIDFILKNISKNDFIQKAEYAFFSISGLKPNLNEVEEEESKAYIRSMNEYWSTIRSYFHGSILDQSKWHFFQLKPQNFPTVRLAGGVRILDEVLNQNLLGKLMSAFEQIDHSSEMIKILKSLVIVPARGFWKTHINFDKTLKVPLRYFIGGSRAEEIVINVILPFIKVLSDVFGRKKDAMKVISVYKTMLQKTDNRITIDVANALSLPEIWKQSVFYQGLIELFREYCSKKRCKECDIGKTIQVEH